MVAYLPTHLVVFKESVSAQSSFPSSQKHSIFLEPFVSPNSIYCISLVKARVFKIARKYLKAENFTLLADRITGADAVRVMKFVHVDAVIY